MSIHNRKITRRDFMRITGLAGAGVGLASLSPRFTVLAQEVKKGGKLVIGLNGDTKTLDPHVSQLWVWQNARRQMFEQLLRGDGTGNILPFLAKEFKWVDNTTLELTLRTDVVFHNGEAFSADDVKYTFDRLATPDLPSEYPPRLKNVKEVEVTAPDKVVFHLESPDATFPNLLTDIDMISKSVPADQLATTPVGTGAFKFGEWLPNERLRFVRFDQYHEAGQPYLDEIIYRPIPDSEARIASLLAGDIDVNFEVAIKDIARLATSDGVEVKKLSGGTLWIFYLNLTQPPFDDKRVRQAVLYGFDRQRYNRDFLSGLARVTNTPIDPTNFAYNAEVDTMYGYDPEKAKSLLAEAGYSESKPLEIEIIYPVGLEEYKTASEFFQSQMGDIGVTVKIVGMELAAWSNKIIKEKSYQIAFDGRGVAVTEPADPYNDFTFTKPDPENFDGFTEETIPGYLDLIKQGLQETDQAKRKEIYLQLQQMWADELPGYILVASPNFLVARDWVMDYDKWGAQPFRLFETWVNK